MLIVTDKATADRIEAERKLPRLDLSARFDDIEAARHAAGYEGPTAEHVQQILAWAQGTDRYALRIVNCGQGISRSAAAALGILVSEGLSPKEAIAILAYTTKIAQSWGWRPVHDFLLPNRYLVWLFDEALKQEGQLYKAVVEHYSYGLNNTPLFLREGSH